MCSWKPPPFTSHVNWWISKNLPTFGWITFSKRVWWAVHSTQLNLDYFFLSSFSWHFCIWNSFTATFNTIERGYTSHNFGLFHIKLPINVFWKNGFWYHRFELWRRRRRRRRRSWRMWILPRNYWRGGGWNFMRLSSAWRLQRLSCKKD